MPNVSITFDHVHLVSQDPRAGVSIADLTAGMKAAEIAALEAAGVVGAGSSLDSFFLAG